MVNRKGRRFIDEASNHNAFGAAFHGQDVSAFRYANLPCRFILNQSFYGEYPCLTGGPTDTFEQGATPPQWVLAAPTLRGLAGRVGIDADGLERTVRGSTRTAPGAATPTSTGARRRTICGGAIRASRPVRSGRGLVMRSR